MMEMVSTIFQFLGALMIVGLIIGAVLFVLGSILALGEWVMEHEHAVATSLLVALIGLPVMIWIFVAIGGNL